MDNQAEAHRKRRLVVFAMGFLASSLTNLRAEEKHTAGVIAVTFHENTPSRTKPDRFYVTSEKGLVRWKNYQDTNRTRLPNSKKVYEVKDGFTIRNTIRKTPAQENARGPSFPSSTPH